MEVESGFINSQPSMAEFMTALPHIGETFVNGGETFVNGGGGSSQPPSTQSAEGNADKSYGGGGTTAGVAVPEYPWMKEKKTTRKQQQGEMFYCF